MRASSAATRSQAIATAGSGFRPSAATAAVACDSKSARIYICLGHSRHVAGHAAVLRGPQDPNQGTLGRAFVFRDRRMDMLQTQAHAKQAPAGDRRLTANEAALRLGVTRERVLRL